MRSTARLSLYAFPLLLALAAGARAEERDPLHDPLARGPHALASRRIVVRASDGTTAPLEVRLPTGGARGPRPCVLVLHGWADSPRSFVPLAEHLGSRGFAVGLVRQPSRLAIDPDVWTLRLRAAIDAVEREARPGGVLAGEIDVGRIGVIGHSYGGATAIMAAARDARIKTVVALAPGTHPLARGKMIEAARAVTVPLQIQGSELDVVVPARFFAKPAFEAARSARERLYVEIRGGEHINFGTWNFKVYVPGFLLGESAGRSSIPSERQRSISLRYATAWLERHLGVREDRCGLTDGSCAADDKEKGVLSQALCVRRAAPRSEGFLGGLGTPGGAAASTSPRPTR